MLFVVTEQTQTNGGQLVGGVTTQQVIDIYKSLRSFAGIAKPNGAPVGVNLPAAVGADYDIQHLTVATVGGEIRGEAFEVGPNYITATRDMFAVSVTCMLVGTWANSDNTVLGIGIGDPLAIPSQPGVDVAGNYVSRFRDSAAGQGNNREVTLATPYEPVGKSTTEIDVYGIKAGDKLFPVAWTQETDANSISIIDLIFTVQEISI